MRAWAWSAPRPPRRPRRQGDASLLPRHGRRNVLLGRGRHLLATGLRVGPGAVEHVLVDRLDTCRRGLQRERRMRGVVQLELVLRAEAREDAHGLLNVRVGYRLLVEARVVGQLLVR